MGAVWRTAGLILCVLGLVSGLTQASEVKRRMALVAAPPASAGEAVAQVVVMDEHLRARAGMVRDPFRAFVSSGAAEVVRARGVGAAGEPTHTVVAFDQSGSVGSRDWSLAFELARTLPSAMAVRGRDAFEVVTFGATWRVHGTASDPATLAALLDAVEREGAGQPHTRLHGFIRDAIFTAEARLPIGSGGLRQVIVFTDAGEESLAYTASDVLEAAWEHGVRVHMMVLPRRGAGSGHATRLDAARRISEETGGRFVQVEDGSTAIGALTDIAQAAQHTWWGAIAERMDATSGDRGLD